MEQRDFIQLLIGVVVGLLGWLLKELWEDHKSLKADVGKLALKMPSEFAAKTDVKEAKEMIANSEERLNAKIDKTETTLLSRIDSFNDRVSDWFIEIGKKLDNKADKK